MPLTILTTRPLPLPDMEIARKRVKWVVLGSKLETIPQEARVLLCTSLDPVNADLINHLPPSVKLIVNLGVGVDHIDLAAAQNRGIAVSNTPVVTEDTADLAFGLILAACRRIGQGDRFIRAGDWSESNPLPDMGMRVHGRTLGLIGYGHIGQAVAKRAQGFDMSIVYYTPRTTPGVYGNATAVASIEDLIVASDIVSLHLPLLPQTRHIIDADRLKLFKPGAVLINTSRGPLIDEKALARALKSGAIAAAGLDVFEHEPEVAAELLACDNVVLTPHIGSATHACRQDIFKRGISNIESFLTIGKPVDIA